MKSAYALFAILAFSVSAMAAAQPDTCLNIMRTEAAPGSTLVVLGNKASKEIFAASSKTQIYATYDILNDRAVENFQSESMACCRFRQQLQLVPYSERCVLSVALDGSLSKIDTIFLK